MNKIDHFLYRKKAEFWIRLSIAARSLRSDRTTGFFDRLLYGKLSGIAERLFLKFAADEVANWKVKMAQEDCKHDKAGPDSDFCPSCGKQLGAGDPEVAGIIERTVRKVLSEYDIKPKKPSGGGTGKGAEGGSGGEKSLREKLGLKKEGK